MNNILLTQQDVVDRLRSLTQRTSPYGTEVQHYDTLMHKYGATYVDGIGWYVRIGESRTLFASHLDTASSKVENIKHVYDGRFLRSNGKTILGADDKSGVLIFLHMMECGVPGTYWFFVGEERGRIGSQRLADGVFVEDGVYSAHDYDRVICFDRRGYGDVITSQSCGDTASDEFAEALCDQLITHCGLYMRPSDRGIYTDSASFAYAIPECTNISVGYFDEHSDDERQDVTFLTRLVNGAPLIDWEGLPIGKKPLEEPAYTKYSSKHSTYYSGGGYTPGYKKMKNHRQSDSPWEWDAVTGEWTYTGNDPVMLERFGGSAAGVHVDDEPTSDDTDKRELTEVEGLVLMEAFTGLTLSNDSFSDFVDDEYMDDYNDVEEGSADERILWAEWEDVTALITEIKEIISSDSLDGYTYPRDTIDAVIDLAYQYNRIAAIEQEKAVADMTGWNNSFGVE